MSAGCDDATPTQKLVLIVDDMADNRILLDRGLKSSGYATVMASSGREALSILQDAKPDIVLLDWMMPGLSGLDTLRAIRETHPAAKLPVIMCTAIGDEMSVVTAINAGATDYMTKPVSLPILRARIAAHLQQRKVVDTLDAQRSQAERRLIEQTRTMLGSPPPAGRR